jgi:hypothetical protein
MSFYLGSSLGLGLGSFDLGLFVELFDDVEVLEVVAAVGVLEVEALGVAVEEVGLFPAYRRSLGSN